MKLVNAGGVEIHHRNRMKIAIACGVWCIRFFFIEFFCVFFYTWKILCIANDESQQQ